MLLTVNPYLGRDVVEFVSFWLKRAAATAGVFVLVRTSNPGGTQFQDLGCDGKPLYQHVAEAVGAWASENFGACGFGDVGAVVGATHPAEAGSLVRQWIPHRDLSGAGLRRPRRQPQPTPPQAFARMAPGQSLTAREESSRASSRTSRKWEEATESARRDATIEDLQQGTPLLSI